MVLHGIALHLMILHSPSCRCIVSYGVAWYCIVGFGARAVSRKTPTYFILDLIGCRQQIIRNELGGNKSAASKVNWQSSLRGEKQRLKQSPIFHRSFTNFSSEWNLPGLGQTCHRVY